MAGLPRLRLLILVNFLLLNQPACGFTSTLSRQRLHQPVSVQSCKKDAVEKSSRPAHPDHINAPQERRAFIVTVAGAAAAVGAAAAGGAARAVGAAPPPPEGAAAATLSSTQGIQWRPLQNFGRAGAQTTYSQRFTSYLTRFLINYDPATKELWAARSKIIEDQGAYSLPFFGTNKDDLEEERVAAYRTLFAELETSVNYGLATRYAGPEGARELLRVLVRDFGGPPVPRPSEGGGRRPPLAPEARRARRQIALLFALQLKGTQPVADLRRLLAETDNRALERVTVEDGGRGYPSGAAPPAVRVQAPALAGEGYPAAAAEARMAPTGQLLAIKVEDGGSGYRAPPRVQVLGQRAAEGGAAGAAGAGGRAPPAAAAVAVLRGDRVERVDLLNAGEGYLDEDEVEVAIDPPEGRAGAGARARAVLSMKVAEVRVTSGGAGYTFSPRPAVAAAPPPPPPRGAAPAAVAPPSLLAYLAREPGERVVQNWLPDRAMADRPAALLPDALTPTYDPCQDRFYISPVPDTDPKYCINYEADKWEIFKKDKITSTYSLLDGSKPQFPVEKERKLDASIYAKFALSGSISAATAHLFLIPIDVVKTKIQSRPSEYTGLVQGFKKVIAEEPKSLLDGFGATISGYFVFGTFSFGVTEFMKRYIKELVGPEISAYYPIPILLFSSAVAGAMGGFAVAPFEALRIRSVAVEGYPKSLSGCFQKVVKDGNLPELWEGAPVLVCQELPFITTKFATFNAVTQLVYGLYPSLGDQVSTTLLVSLFSGMFAGVVAALVSQPLDTINIKINSKADKDINTIPKAARALLAEGGPARLYKGALPRAVKSAVNIAVQFFTYDACKTALHVTADELRLFFDVLSGLQLTQQ